MRAASAQFMRLERSLCVVLIRQASWPAGLPASMPVRGERAAYRVIDRMMFFRQRSAFGLFCKGGVLMLGWSILFLIVAIIAGVFGFGGIAVAATDIARLLFVVFLILFVISLLLGRRSTSMPL